MKHTKLITLIILISSVVAIAYLSASNFDKMSAPENNVDSLLNLMTLEEKIGQLNQYSIGADLTGPGEKEGDQQVRYDLLKSGQVGSVLNLIGAEEAYKTQKFVVENTRLGIPLIFAYDVIHGYKTIFPLPLAESSSWNLDLMKKTAAVAAKEAAAAGIQWTFAPMVDISRDARWGRVMEGAGEDPYLGSLIGVARIQGFQGDDLSDFNTIAACAKHFAGYGFVESGKDYNNVYLGKHQLLNTIIPPFKAGADANVATFMNAFNDIDGIPSTANEYLLRDLLKGQWNYDGVVVSDWNSIGEIVEHGTAANKYEAAVQAMNAGSDIDMEGNAYVQNLKKAVENGDVKIEDINDAVRRVLKLKYDLGLFDDPYKYFDTDREKATLYHDDHVQLAYEAAKESIVLLKNEGDLLPIKDQKLKIGLIGPLMKDKDSPIGNWRAAGESNSAVSLFEGLKEAMPEATFKYAEGCKLSVGPNNFFNPVKIEENDKSGFSKAIEVAKSSDVVIVAMGETAYMSGESRSRSTLDLPGLQPELLKELKKANPNIILVLMNGRPLTLSWEDENIPAIIEAWHLGSKAGNAIADVITGNVNPSGKLTMTFPRTVGQVPIYYNHKNTGRPTAGSNQVFFVHHNDVDSSPLYPFGYGLSYSVFEYSDITISDTLLNMNETIEVSVNISNKSDLDGEEVVQMYIRDVTGSITRPVKELKGFEKILIKPGETKKVSFEISKDQLSFYTRNYEYKAEPGDFIVMIGPNSRDLKSKNFKLITNEKN
ncbi:beta-glucosidase BglX [Marinigracilibium pacificum]|uniref:beta-glucosidase n=1 Tax=Marinigracilibium pacificum TaxID=2729599 RepID=A0A848J1X2_9BACT|nr:beta-glucosidase BglX [Marinigracilibium pacificum]NMM48540.1 beta-glucosidase BglX [Marinigracilibium pacificum]